MKLVIFDMDGTLVDSQAYIIWVMEQTFAAEGLPVPTPEARRQIIGLSLPLAVERLSGLKGEAGDRMVARYRAIFHEHVEDGSEHEPLFSGMAEVIETLAARPDMLLGIATGKALRGVNRILHLHGFEGKFATLQTPDHNPSKPHPGMIERAMAETGVAAENTVMVGDATYDIDMARAAGVKSIAVDWGYHGRGQLLASGPSRIVDRREALVPAIDELLGGAHA